MNTLVVLENSQNFQMESPRATKKKDIVHDKTPAHMITVQSVAGDIGLGVTSCRQYTRKIPVLVDCGINVN